MQGTSLCLTTRSGAKARGRSVLLRALRVPSRPGWLMRSGIACALAVLMGLPVLGQSDAVTIDDQPTTEQKLVQVNTLRRDGRFDDAADLVQELIDDARFKLVAVEPGRYIDAERWVFGELSRDAQLLSAYQRRFNTSAQRLLTLASESGDLQALREVFRRYAMTSAGLHAGLDLAGRFLERGQIAAARTLVDQLGGHPGKHEQRVRLLHLRGICAAYQDNQELARDCELRLRESGELAVAEQLDRLIASVRVVDFDELIDAGDRPEGLDRPLWQTPVTVARQVSGVYLTQAAQGLRILPLVVGERVLINSGSSLSALDRASGKPLWVFPADDQILLPSEFDRMRRVWHDTRGVVASGDSVFAVVGACRGLSGRGQENVPPNLLVCVSAATGQMRWARASADIRPGEPALFESLPDERINFQQTHFVGTPVVTQGQVFVLLRKANMQGIQTTWLAAYDLASGQMQWVRHLALVQIIADNDSRYITPQLAARGDMIYVTDNMAVAAAIEASSGAYRWLRVIADGRERRFNRLNIQSTGAVAPPVVTDAGLVVQLSLNDQRLYLLDPRDGRTLRDLQDDIRLQGAQYILDAGADVLVVSLSSVALIDGQTGLVRWHQPFSPIDARAAGRGDVTRQFAVIPTTRGLRVLRLTDGELIQDLEMGWGNVLAMDAEILISGEGGLRSYMSWDQASRRLRDRIHTDPQDPTPGLSMALLAMMRPGNEAVVLEGLSFALEAVGRLTGAQAQQAREQVFSGLREIAGNQDDASQTLRREVYDLMAIAAQTASQTAVYHLDVGRFLAHSGQPQLAVEHFQAVMVDPVLAGQGYNSGGTTLAPAGGAAQRELLELVREHGRGIYARYDALARHELDALIARDTEPEPLELVGIARRYPLAHAGSEALLIAGRQLEASGRQIGALGQSQQAFARAITNAQRQSAAGELLSFYVRCSRQDEARALLREISTRSPGLTPPREGTATSLQDWLAIFDASDAAARLPALSNQLAQPLIVPGRLLTHLNAAPQADPLSGHVYVQTQDGNVMRIDPRDAQVLWTAPVSDGQVIALNNDHGQLLLWLIDQAKLIALDSRTGQAQWDRPADLSMIDHRPQGVVGPEVPEDRLPLTFVGPTVVGIAGSGGTVVAIDRYTGAVAWQVETGLAEISAMAGDPRSLAVAGVAGPEATQNSGKIVLLDLLTGDLSPGRSLMYVRYRPGFVGLSNGVLAVVNSSQAMCEGYDAMTGQPIWSKRLVPSVVAGPCFGKMHGDLLAVKDNNGTVFLVDAQHGRLLHTYQLGIIAGAGQLHSVGLAQGMGLQLFGATMFCDRDGKRVWRDAISTPYKRIYRTLYGQQRLAVLAATTPEANPQNLLGPGQQVAYQLFILGRRSGDIQAEYQIGPISGQIDPRRAVLAGEGLAISMGWQTLLIPASP